MTTSIPEMSIAYQQVVEALGDAVVICDRDGVIRFWNVAAERLFGFTRTDALGKSLDLIIPERLRQRHWAGYDKAMARVRRVLAAIYCEFQPYIRMGGDYRSRLRWAFSLDQKERLQELRP